MNQVIISLSGNINNIKNPSDLSKTGYDIFTLNAFCQRLCFKSATKLFMYKCMAKL